MTVQIEYYESEPLSAKLPEKVTCTIAETEPAVKGQTAANSFKPAVLDNGIRVTVPPFVNSGEGGRREHRDHGVCRAGVIAARPLTGGKPPIFPCLSRIRLDKRHDERWESSH